MIRTPLPAFAPLAAVLLALLALGGEARADEPDVLATASTEAALVGTAAAIALDDDDLIVATHRAGRGGVVRLDAAGDVVASVSFDSAALDVAVDARTGTTVVLLGDGLVALDPALAPIWRVELESDGPDGHVAIGEDGTVAAVIDTALHVLTADGHTLARATVPIDEATGVAVIDAHDRVVVAGTRATHSCDRAVEDAALVAFDRGGTLRWDAYAAAAAARPCETRPADTRLLDVTRGDDGELYVIGEVEGAPEARLFDALHGPDVLVAFDAHSTAPAVASARVAYYARVSWDGVPTRAQYLGFADEFSTVRPDAIAADAAGNVSIVGASSHTLEIDEAEAAEALGGAVGFYQVLTADLSSRRLWREFSADDLDVARVRFAAGPGRAVAVVTPARGGDEAPATGPSVLVLPTQPEAGQPGRRPDRDDVGTFGYESGVSGVDPTCYCDVRRAPPSSAWLVGLVSLVLMRPRRRVGAVK